MSTEYICVYMYIHQLYNGTVHYRFVSTPSAATVQQSNSLNWNCLSGLSAININAANIGALLSLVE